MATLVKRPYCDSFYTSKTTDGKISDALAKIGAFVDGSLLQMGQVGNVKEIKK